MNKDTMEILMLVTIIRTLMNRASQTMDKKDLEVFISKIKSEFSL